jgi:cell division protease FtsH
MPDRGDAERRNSEGKSKGNWIWYLLLGGTLAALLGAMVIQGATFRLSYPDLIALLQNTEYSQRGATQMVEGRSGKIVLPSSGSSGRREELSQIRNVRVDDKYVYGKATYRLLDANDKVIHRTETIEFRTPKDASDNTASELRGLLDQSKVAWNHTEGPGILSQYLPLILPLLIVLGAMAFMMRRLGGVGSPMSFGRSRGKLYAQEEIGIMFPDVAGIDEAVEEVREIVDFLRHPDKYQRLGGRIPKGVLLVGPPGTGKTLLAKAIAGEAGVPFFSLSGSDFVEMFVGVGAARVRDMFQQATAKAPCIIFIDELDALGKSRAGNIVGSHDEREQTLNALLVEMDGFDANAGVIVVAATNRPETLDPALLRPGRFDRHVLVDRPDIQGREAILRVHVKNVKLAADVDLRKISAITSGFVGADLANLVNEAALLAARKGKDSVGQEEFNDGVERVTAGLEKKKRVMNDDEKRRVAYHEAGHALVACSIPHTDPVHKVSIIPRGIAALGYTMQRPEEDRYLMTQAELEAQIQVLLAGTLTEEIVFRDISTGAQNDLERATHIARSMVTDYGMSRLGRINYRESNRSPFLAGGGGGGGAARDYSEQTAQEIDLEVKRIIDDSVRKTMQVLRERRAALEAVTQRLMEKEVIDSDDLQEIIDRTLQGPRVALGTLPAAPGIQSAETGLSSQPEIGLAEGEDQPATGAI